MERRQFLRQCVSLPVRFKFLDSESPLAYEGTSRDIGLGGVFVNRPLKDEELGKEASLEISLPDASIPVKAIKARTTWVERTFEDKINGFGLEFMQISPDQKERLQTYVLEFTSHAPPKFKTIRPPDYRLSDKEKRGLEILDALRRDGPISKTQIAQGVNLNIVTISNYIEEFKKKGLICERGLDESSGGRRPSLLEINRKYGFVIGVELNLEENLIVALILDFGFRLIAKKKAMTKKVPAIFVDNLEGEILNLIEEARVDRSRILGIGLGTTGFLNNHVGLKDLLGENFKLPLLIEDGSVTKIYSEVWQDADLAKKENILYVGLDGSLSMILKGDLYRGFNGASLRMGLNEIERTNEDNGGCWLNDDCLLRRDTGAINAKNASELGKRFGIRIAYLINMLNPQVVIINKAAEETPELFFASLKEAAKRWTFSESTKNIKIVTSKYSEDSVAQGAAALVLRDIYSQL